MKVKSLGLGEGSQIERTPSIVSVGNFDGVHLGHTSLIRTLVERSRRQGRRSVVVTFEPHTRTVLHPGQTQPLLSVFEEKQDLIEPLGPDLMVQLRFDTDVRSLAPLMFARTVLHERLGADEWVMGSDHRFGRDATGDKFSLHEDDSTYHITSFAADLETIHGRQVSSTAIRTLIRSGDIAAAARMLGHPYLMRLRRVAGIGLGSSIGCPTLNFSGVLPGKVVPPAGVYAARLCFDATVCNGALYYGNCPTFGERDVHFEFHALSPPAAGGPPVGEWAQVWLHAFIRPDHRYASGSELVTQIQKDIISIEHFFSEEH